MVPRRGPGNGTRPGTFQGGTRGDVACRVCRVTLQCGHWGVRFSCGQRRHVLRSRCSFETLARGAAPLRCQKINYGARYTKRGDLRQRSKRTRVFAVGPLG